NSPVNFECRLIRVVRVADNTVFFGEAVRLHVDDRVLTNGIVDARKLHAIGRLGGPQYCRTQDVFEMVRPRVTGPRSARPTGATCTAGSTRGPRAWRVGPDFPASRASGTPDTRIGS